MAYLHYEDDTKDFQLTIRTSAKRDTKNANWVPNVKIYDFATERSVRGFLGSTDRESALIMAENMADDEAAKLGFYRA